MTGPSNLAPLPISMVVTLAVDAPMLASPIGIASTMIREDVIYLRGMYKVSNHIRIFVPDHSDRVTSSPEGGIALYDGFFHARLCLPLYPFILSLLDYY